RRRSVAQAARRARLRLAAARWEARGAERGRLQRPGFHPELDVRRLQHLLPRSTGARGATVRGAPPTPQGLRDATERLGTPRPGAPADEALSRLLSEIVAHHHGGALGWRGRDENGEAQAWGGLPSRGPGRVVLRLRRLRRQDVPADV